MAAVTPTKPTGDGTTGMTPDSKLFSGEFSDSEYSPLKYSPGAVTHTPPPPFDPELLKTPEGRAELKEIVGTDTYNNIIKGLSKEEKGIYGIQDGGRRRRRSRKFQGGKSKSKRKSKRNGKSKRSKKSKRRRSRR